jgi:hypothetical protein
MRATYKVGKDPWGISYQSQGTPLLFSWSQIAP